MPIFPQFEEKISSSNKSHENLLFCFTLEQLIDICERIGLDRYRGKQLWTALYRQRVASIQEITVLPLRVRDSLVESGYRIGLPEITETFTSSDGTERYLIACPDGETVETVWMPNGDDGELGDGSEAAREEKESDHIAHPEVTEATEGSRVFRQTAGSHSTRLWLAQGRLSTSSAAADFARNDKPIYPTVPRRATICVSSQVGCAVNCQFCLTAKLGIKRNLTAGEIAGQVVAVLNRHRVRIGKDRINIVFMGMGEPFLNYDNFIAAVNLLVAGIGIPESRMTVSTSGILPGIERFAAENIRPKLALSLNAPNDSLREEIMPITRKWRIDALVDALKAIPLRPRERLTMEYVLLGGVNDRLQDAQELAELVSHSGLRAKVNLIAWNPGPDIPYRMPSSADVAAFQQRLIAGGIPAFLRRPRGRDIYAACGQLKRTME
jgi:23S rRNA (adenine2503-C2)-methyltransferase